MTLKSSQKNAWLRVIAVMKLGKAMLLTGLGFGLFRSINANLGETARQVAIRLRIDPENHLVRLFLEKVAKVDPHSLRTAGLISFVYAGLLYVEGFGLWLNQAWAEYLVLVATGLFIPWEGYSMAGRFSWDRAVLLLVNLAIFLAVAAILWREKKRRQKQAA